MDSNLTVITVTDGKDSLFSLIDSMKNQGLPVRHLIIWDDKRAGKFLSEGVPPVVTPLDIETKDELYSANCIVLKNFTTTGKSNASALRAVGLMASSTPWVTFADDDVIWEDGHLSSMMAEMGKEENQWVFCKRNIWAKLPDGNFEYLGVDEFESVGEKSKLPYKTINNNCLMFKRRYGTSAACLYRETQDLNDDRLMYEFLMKYAPIHGETNLPTVSQVCPERLTKFFRDGCTKA